MALTVLANLRPTPQLVFRSADGPGLL